jgi:hypothetical protein
MDPLVQLFAMLAKTQAGRTGGTTHIEKSLRTILDKIPFRWSVFSASQALMEQVRSLVEHLRAFEDSPSTLLTNAENVLAWHQRLRVGEIQLVGALRGCSQATRVFQCLLLRMHWLTTLGADKPEATKQLYERLFSEQVWDEFDDLTKGHSDKSDVVGIEVSKTVKLIKLTADLKTTGSRSSGNIKALFDDIKASNEKLVQAKAACIPPSVLAWAHGQVEKIGAANSVIELTAILCQCPYTKYCAKICVEKSKITRKLLKGVRNALFIRFDEITA